MSFASLSQSMLQVYEIEQQPIFSRRCTQIYCIFFRVRQDTTFIGRQAIDVCVVRVCVALPHRLHRQPVEPPVLGQCRAEQKHTRAACRQSGRLGASQLLVRLHPRQSDIPLPHGGLIELMFKERKIESLTCFYSEYRYYCN